MKTFKKKESIEAMEKVILKDVAFITEDFFGKGLLDVKVGRIDNKILAVSFNFKVVEDVIIRVCATIDADDLEYIVSVYSSDDKRMFLAFCKFESDFHEVLIHQCSNLSELPF